jgi:hypothetical protein
MSVFVVLADKLPLGEIPSQLLPVQVCREVDAVKLVTVVTITSNVYGVVVTTLVN